MWGGRAADASINYVTAHDGFTLHDLVSYNEKHNEANGEGNQDGANENMSWNCGVEGPTDDPAIVPSGPGSSATSWPRYSFAGRADVARRRRTRPDPAGNNNAYCQDNEISWLELGRCRPRLTEIYQKPYKTPAGNTRYFAAGAGFRARI